MASTADSIRRSPFSAGPHLQGMHKSIPILPSTSGSSTLTPPRDPMDITPSAVPTMGPPVLSSPVGDRNGTNGDADSATNGNAATAIGAAAAAQQPKVVQTAFIHKLYNMLEDQTIQHLISWSNTNESFVMSPSSEFSKVLSSYFKHTNISSFVRQLNMYGFHKVSDVFHTGSPDSPLWEFKHGNGSFKRGDLVGLREIKRRASRHALIHRDSFPAGPKVPTGPPAGVPVEPMPDPVESRLGMLEHGYYEMSNRMNRAEDSYAYLNQKYQVVMEGLMKCHQWNHELTNYIMAIVQDPENPVHKDVTVMQRDIARQSEMLRAIEEPGEPLSARQPYFMQIDNAPPLSPRQIPQDDHRRSSLAPNSRQAPFRPPVPAHLAISPRRYGSIGAGTYSPSSARTPVHQPPPPPPPTIHHPANPSSAAGSPPYNLYRRHTSADIRLHGWQAPPPPPAHSPYASGANSTAWPSSPHRAPLSGGDQQIRDALAQYELPRGPVRPHGSRHGTPPPPLGGDAGPSGLGNLSVNAESGWALPGRAYPFKGVGESGPPTRRSSMASNVHSLLNPAETAEREGEDEGGEDMRKRKRVQ